MKTHRVRGETPRQQVLRDQRRPHRDNESQRHHQEPSGPPPSVRFQSRDVGALEAPDLRSQNRMVERLLAPKMPTMARPFQRWRRSRGMNPRGLSPRLLLNHSRILSGWMSSSRERARHMNMESTSVRFHRPCQRRSLQHHGRGCFLAPRVHHLRSYCPKGE